MINLRELTKYYGDLCAVDRINLNVNRGEILGLLGPNGAGKTTTLRMMTGFLAPSEGDIVVNGKSIHSDALAVKSCTGYLPESAPSYPAMLVHDFLDFVGQMRGLKKKRRTAAIEQLADVCALKEVMHLPIAHLSKGLRQRVGLAQAMLADPEILVLDEPTSGLDPNQIVEIRKIIRRLGSQKTIIISTHILSEAEATCDRIVIINKGRIIADGSAEQLKNQDLSTINELNLEISRAQWEDVRNLLESLEVVKKVKLVSTSNKSSLKIKVLCQPQGDPRAVVYNTIKTTNWVLLELYRPERSLESIFRHLTMEANP